MLIKGTEGMLPFQNNTTRLAAVSGGKRAGRQCSRYDHISLSAPAEQEKRDFHQCCEDVRHNMEHLKDLY